MKKSLSILTLFAFLFLACRTTNERSISGSFAVRKTASEEEIIGGAGQREVPEGLSGDDMADFHHLSEGADVYPYDWLQALKSVAEKDTYFLDNLDQKFGILKTSAMETTDLFSGQRKKYLVPYAGLTVAWNNSRPDQADAFVGDWGTTVHEKMIYRDVTAVKSIRMLGTNCAVCHSGELQFKGKNFWVEGSSNMVNVRAFFQDLSKSTLSVLVVPENTRTFFKALKVPNAEAKAAELNDYFSKRMAEESHGLFNAGKLSTKLTLLMAKIFHDRDRLFKGHAAIADSLEKMLRLTYGFSDQDNIGDLKARMRYLGYLMVGTSPALKETKSGYARTDAFGRIGNLVLRGDSPIDYTAPVSLPWIWGLKYMAMIHYNANSNSVIMRNTGQSLGLGSIILDPQTKDSTTNLYNLSRIEALVHKIKVPEWKEVFKGETATELKIQQDLAEKGQKLYESNCKACHETKNFVGPTKGLRMYNMTQLSELRTDSMAAQNAIKPIQNNKFQEVIYSGVEGIKERFYQKYSVQPQTIKKWEYFDLRGAEFFRDTFNGFTEQDMAAKQAQYGAIKPGYAYKARHLSGVWATAPFLHNGSVPNLYYLLSPQSQRPKVFLVKSRKFDPKMVGYESAIVETSKLNCTEREDCFNTRDIGKSNTGHEFFNYHEKNRPFSDVEKYAIIEYLKLLPPEEEYSWY